MTLEESLELWSYALGRLEGPDFFARLATANQAHETTFPIIEDEP